jgi:hypothetical protein
MVPSLIFSGFLILFLALMGGYMIVLLRSRDVPFKKKASRWLVGGAMALFLLYVGLLTKELRFVFYASPFALILLYLNLGLTRFCASCGVTLTPHLPFSTLRFCPYCGAEVAGKFK